MGVGRAMVGGSPGAAFGVDLGEHLLAEARVLGVRGQHGRRVAPVLAGGLLGGQRLVPGRDGVGLIPSGSLRVGQPGRAALPSRGLFGVVGPLVCLSLLLAELGVLFRLGLGVGLERLRKRGISGQLVEQEVARRAWRFSRGSTSVAGWGVDRRRFRSRGRLGPWWLFSGWVGRRCRRIG